MSQFDKKKLKKCSKSQLIEIILNIQEGNEVEIQLPQKNSENSSIPSSKDITKKETQKSDTDKKPMVDPKQDTQESAANQQKILT